MAQCEGTTRAGRRCSIDVRSTMADDLGRSVAAPLRCGAPCCLLHARPFASKPVLPEGELLIVFLDLEATGVDPTYDRILEIAALAVVGPSSAAFSTVVHVDADFLRRRGSRAEEIHGISAEESALGPSFASAWHRLVAFVEHLVNSALDQEDTESYDGEPCLPRIADEPPTILVAAHNGVRYDFCMLLFECARNGVATKHLSQWLFLDTLAVVGAMPASFHGGCMKLQCLARGSIAAQDARAHRALDDCVVLRDVMEDAASLLGVSLSELFRHFALRFDEATSAVYVDALRSA